LYNNDIEKKSVNNESVMMNWYWIETSIVVMTTLSHKVENNGKKSHSP